MTDLVIAVHAAPSNEPKSSTRSLLAFRYAQAALALGHQLQQVFFYQAGVLHARVDSQQQLSPIAAKWVQLSREHGFDLVVCSTVLESDYQLQDEQLDAAFKLGGLTEFSAAVAKAERLVQF